ncbi:transcriptional regulator Myc-1-like [Lineus longissimus]|uniref:transcriptional regulator Myc-1-like n=1 Tax=Lineus longissimus TaxID=88925 RepID=UPI00315D8622
MSHIPKSFHWSAHSYCKKMKHPQSIIKNSIGLCPDRESQDYESFHFFEDEIEQDFYAAPAPSEDIWKKFELIPTPPRSPRRDDEDDTDILDMVDGIFSPKSTTERLQLVSEILDDPVTQTIVTPDFFKCACSPNIKSKLIQDCMWSGNLEEDQDCSDEKTDEKPVEKKPASSSVVINANTECVDPSSVFPYPINETTKTAVFKPKESLGIETPSESEDDESDEYDDDDDEEIDVVTVERTIKTSKRRLPTVQVVPNIKIKVKAHSVLPRSSPVNSPIHKSFHNYSMKRKSLSLPGSPQPSSKKLKRELSMQDFKNAVNKFNSNSYSDGRTSRSGSDSEDCEEKRAQHNVLERKRRNDLKFSFFGLRDQIPDLERQERAPKVMILRKASDYIIGLRREQRRLEHLKQAEQSRKEQLLKRIAQLRRTC